MKWILTCLCMVSYMFVSMAQDNPEVILGPEEINNQPNFFLDNLEDANLPNENGEVKLSFYRSENGERTREEAWVKPEMVYQLYVMGSKDREKEFPLEVFSFPNLQTLVFPMWKFDEIPVYISKSLPKLQYLDLQGSNVASLPETLQDMKYLDSVNISETKISDAELAKLRELLPSVTFFK